MRRGRKYLFVGTIAVLAMGLVPVLPGPASAGSKHAAFSFYLTHYELLGRDPANPTGVRYHSDGHPFAKAPDGSTVTLSGQGTWDPASGDAGGGGRYVITNAGGAVTAKGAWHATEFVEFDQLAGWWGIPGFKELGWQGPKDSASFSGFLTLRVALDGLGAGKLVIWCLMPQVRMPGDHVSDGMTLTEGPFNFGDYYPTEQSPEGVMFYSGTVDHHHDH